MNAPDRYAVLGHPVAHSQSPFIHREFARQTGQAMSYERILCPLDDFAGSLAEFGAGDGRGCSVTVPFKFEAFRLASQRSERAVLAQAANTLRRDGGGWSADNTDGVGLLRDIEANAGVPLRGRRVLLAGAGGAGAGVLGPLLDAGPSEVVVVNRTAARADELVARHTDWARRHGVALRSRPLEAPGTSFDVVVNATASSLQGDALPLPAPALAPGALAVDLMYGPAAAAFLAWAEHHGAVARDGLGMLVEQAAAAFEFWRGVRPQSAPVLTALRQRLTLEA